MGFDNSYTKLICVESIELKVTESAVIESEGEGPLECLAGSAVTLIKQLAVGTNSSTLTP